ncbi:MAG: hypothetical protein AB7U44_03090 [Sulfuricurvum sp.]|uniref:hypothetical protein n=1 Tax=Sulfuricurvum sp. TaxID=2025608 RepID=UPI00262573BD|nr:hypothetical protein [Sulfuricurvum sp.]MDD2839450.1 hypothetical protein [Sulfuricurvum sp.]MDD3597614.1 hypothetical protein [Sulfuricurvum sp.]MDD4883115.1 hypothetical protein [Sulfuricurvum sp.]
MLRTLVLSTLAFTFLSASVPSPMSMATDLNLSTQQIKKLQRIDAAVEQVKRHSYAKQIEVLTPDQRTRFCTRQKPLCDNY